MLQLNRCKMMVWLEIKQITVTVAIYTGLTIKTQTYSMSEMYFLQYVWDLFLH